MGQGVDLTSAQSTKVKWELTRASLSDLFLIPSKRQRSPGMAVARCLHFKSSVTRAGYYLSASPALLIRQVLIHPPRQHEELQSLPPTRYLWGYNAAVSKGKKLIPRSSDLGQIFINLSLPFCSHLCCECESLQYEVKSWMLWLTHPVDTELLWAVPRERNTRSKGIRLYCSLRASFGGVLISKSIIAKVTS